MLVGAPYHPDFSVLFVFEGDTGAWHKKSVYVKMTHKRLKCLERETGFEPATFSLGS